MKLPVVGAEGEREAVQHPQDGDDARWLMKLIISMFRTLLTRTMPP